MEILEEDTAAVGVVEDRVQSTFVGLVNEIEDRVLLRSLENVQLALQTTPVADVIKALATDIAMVKLRLRVASTDEG